MRLGLLTLLMSLALWLLTKLSQSYRVEVVKPLWAGGLCGVAGSVRLSVEGKGYELIRYFRAFRDTISLARLCKGPFPLQVRLSEATSLDSLCKRIQPHASRLQVEWVLPPGYDWVEPWQWISWDTLWGCAEIPSHKITLVGKPGLHLYPVVLPREWGVYPETLWIQGHLAPFSWVQYQVRPRVFGAEGYRVLLSPPVLEVAFQVPQRYIREVSPEDIEVVVDMSKVLPQDTVAYLQVRVKKAYIRNLRFRPQAVRFTKVYGG
jgi:hypothetical protein